MNLLKKVPLLLLFIVQINILQAEWNPLFLSDESQYKLEKIKNPQLLELENQITNYLKNSWCSSEKARLILELIVLEEPEVCVEIGPFTGSSTLPMLSALKYLGKGEAYVVDAWSNDEAIRGLPADDPNTIWWKGLPMHSVKNQFKEMVNQWSLGSTYELLHMTSKAASALIPTINFLHLDGNFSEEGSLLDSNLYVPKVVPGGYILISNVLIMIKGKATKMKALWPLFEHCEIICEIDQGNTLLFRKK